MCRCVSCAAAVRSVRFSEMVNTHARFLCIFIFAIFVSARAISKCDEKSTQIDANTCATIAVIKHHRESLKARNQSMALAVCTNSKVGGVKWFLPKVDTEDKNRKFARLLLSRLPQAAKGDAYIWLGLRRYGPKKKLSDIHEWANEKHWLWIRDNSTLMDTHRMNLDFWESNEPNNERARNASRWNESEDCAVARIDTKSPKGKELLMFQDRACTLTKEDGVEIKAIICDHVIAPPRKKKFVEKWYFIFICVLLIIIPSSVLGVVIVCIHRRRRKLRARTRTGTRPRSHSSKSRRYINVLDPRRHRHSPRRTFSVEQLPGDSYRRVKSATSSDDSVLTLTNTELSPARLQRSRIVPIRPSNKGRSTKSLCRIPFRPKAKTTPRNVNDDEEEHQYSNIQPPPRRANKSIPVLKK